jgi:hypothetical protein
MLPRRILTLITLALLVFTAGCDKDDVDPSMPVLKLTPDNVTGKAGRTIDATLFITAPNGAKDVVIYKTVNLERDNNYGGTGTVTATPVSTGGNNYEYHFSYELSPDEVEKLVGFNFRFTDSKGLAAEKDLTVNTTTSGQQIIYSRKWQLISKMWVTAPQGPTQDIQECEKDNKFSWNRDSTVNIEYGTNPCGFDGFNVYDHWELSEDEKTFTQIYHSLFNPAQITTEVYKVRTITKDKLEMEITLDLTIFGLTDKELFVYTYEPAP